MSQPTTIHLHAAPSIRLGTREVESLRRLAVIAIHLATTAVLAASIATAVATSGDRAIGEPSRVGEPSVVTRSVETPAVGSVALPAPAPTPQPGF